MINKQLLIDNSPIALDDTTLSKLEKYAQLLIGWNEKVNLTAITDPEEITRLHFLDCLYPLSYIEKGASVIDVGTGAGFPGIVLKIARPDIELTLLDALNKRLNFLTAVCNELELDAEIIHGRAEDVAHDQDYREQFDYATARAVAPLNVLCEYCLPFVKEGGRFVAMKGKEYEMEIKNAQNSLSALGGKATAHAYTLFGGDQRAIVVIDKIEKCNAKYPRRAAAISKKPL